jgi:hypothetical protein
MNWTGRNNTKPVEISPNWTKTDRNWLKYHQTGWKQSWTSQNISKLAENRDEPGENTTKFAEKVWTGQNTTKTGQKGTAPAGTSQTTSVTGRNNVENFRTGRNVTGNLQNLADKQQIRLKHAGKFNTSRNSLGNTNANQDSSWNTNIGWDSLEITNGGWNVTGKCQHWSRHDFGLTWIPVDPFWMSSFLILRINWVMGWARIDLTRLGSAWVKSIMMDWLWTGVGLKYGLDMVCLDSAQE